MYKNFDITKENALELIIVEDAALNIWLKKTQQLGLKFIYRNWTPQKKEIICYLILLSAYGTYGCQTL